jgi:hypothetical protein
VQWVQVPSGESRGHHTCPQMGQLPKRVIDSGYLNG